MMSLFSLPLTFSFLLWGRNISPCKMYDNGGSWKSMCVSVSLKTSTSGRSIIHKGFHFYTEKRERRFSPNRLCLWCSFAFNCQILSVCPVIRFRTLLLYNISFWKEAENCLNWRMRRRVVIITWRIESHRVALGNNGRQGEERSLLMFSSFANCNSWRRWWWERAS